MVLAEKSKRRSKHHKNLAKLAQKKKKHKGENLEKTGEKHKHERKCWKKKAQQQSLKSNLLFVFILKSGSPLKSAKAIIL